MTVVILYIFWQKIWLRSSMKKRVQAQWDMIGEKSDQNYTQNDVKRYNLLSEFFQNCIYYYY